MALFLVIAACGKGGEEQDQGRTYVVSGVVETDSTISLENLMLYADNHSSLRVDTIELDAGHRFESQLRTAGFDELYLCSDAGELCRFYATEGMEVEVSLTMGEQGLVTRFLPTATDSINAWLQQMDSLFIGQKETRLHDIMDSVTAQRDTSLRPALLLRNHVLEFQDSLYVRRLLGGMPASAKPEWLVKSIDHQLNEVYAGKRHSRRLEAVSFDVKDDSIPYNLDDPRSDYLLICFWANYSLASIDSLKMIEKMLKDDYADKRVQFLSCCLHASDSTWWTLRTLNMQGRHTWIKGGMGDSRMSDWGIREVPSVILLDMYNNQQIRNEWGAPLRRSLDRLPKKAPSI